VSFPEALYHSLMRVIPGKHSDLELIDFIFTNNLAQTTTILKKRIHNHNNNQTNPKLQPKPKNKPTTNPKKKCTHKKPTTTTKQKQLKQRTLQTQKRGIQISN
jgi:hypothetical protein